MNNYLKLFLIALLITSCSKSFKDVSFDSPNDQHPNLILTTKSVSEIKSKLGKVPLFDATLEKAKEDVDVQLEKGIDVPIPKDMAGGYTHTQHKINYATMHKAGILFQLTGDEKYAHKREVMQEVRFFGNV